MEAIDIELLLITIGLLGMFSHGGGCRVVSFAGQ